MKNQYKFKCNMYPQDAQCCTMLLQTPLVLTWEWVSSKGPPPRFSSLHTTLTGLLTHVPKPGSTLQIKLCPRNPSSCGARPFRPALSFPPGMPHMAPAPSEVCTRRLPSLFDPITDCTALWLRFCKLNLMGGLVVRCCWLPDAAVVFGEGAWCSSGWSTGFCQEIHNKCNRSTEQHLGASNFRVLKLDPNPVHLDL